MWCPLPVMKHSSLSSRHVSETSSKSKQHWTNSEIKSSQHDSPGMFCKFFVMTCLHCSSWSASFVATWNGLSPPSLVAVFLISEEPAMYNPYSMSEMNSDIASCTTAGTLLASFHSMVKSFFTHAMDIAFPFSACNWQSHFWGTCLPTQPKICSVCWQFWPDSVPCDYGSLPPINYWFEFVGAFSATW